MPVYVTAGALCVGGAVPGPESKQPKGLGQCLLSWVYPIVALFSDGTKSPWDVQGEEQEPPSSLERTNTYLLL